MSLNFESYKNPNEYPKRPSRPNAPKSDDPKLYRAFADALEAHNKDMKIYHDLCNVYSKASNELHDKFRTDALREVGLGLRPDDLQSRAYEYAWDKGHAYGFSEVFLHLQSIAYVITGE